MNKATELLRIMDERRPSSVSQDILVKNIRKHFLSYIRDKGEPRPNAFYDEYIAIKAVPAPDLGNPFPLGDERRYLEMEFTSEVEDINLDRFYRQFLRKRITQMGWYEVVDSTVSFLRRGEIHDRHIKLAPFHDETLDLSTVRYLYHIRSARSIERIRRKGLTPAVSRRGSIMSYPPSIFVGLTDRDVFRVISTMYGGNPIPRTDLYMIKLDTTKLRPGTKFYKDSHFKPGYYTPTPIPKEAIVSIRKIGKEYDDEIGEYTAYKYTD